MALQLTLTVNEARAVRAALILGKQVMKHEPKIADLPIGDMPASYYVKRVIGDLDNKLMHDRDEIPGIPEL